MSPRVLILGAGFGGLEVATVLSEEFGEDIEITLIDSSDTFVFGFAKLDVLFGKKEPEAVKFPYADVAKPGVRYVRETIASIDPERLEVTTDAGRHSADHLVIALGADYDFDATPGLAEVDSEFYSVAGAERLAKVLPEFEGGRALVGVCGAPFKCPPAPSECALMLHDYLVERGIRDQSSISVAIPFETPVPPSPGTSEALLEAFAERDIDYVGGSPVVSLDPDRRVAVNGAGRELPFDLFLGVPKHRAPDVVIETGLTVDGYISVKPSDLKTSAANVWAVGDVTTVGVPKAGVFSEGAGRVAARSIAAEIRGEPAPGPYDGLGSCYIEFGFGNVARVDVDFLSGPKPTGTFQAPSETLAAEKAEFGSTRASRWFGR
ncbi:MAG: FAD-dependent oxidoreductase [Solirubrobacterales bacterium]|nr:FAD-dependent oxidoreductase [Solirubrobacterales bacterium]MCB8971013.1 FAD-dependent oxidoreductase [Thermoleophilales bacterium]MCO5326093.1 FAD-dependent oxidoreductase [Solirubrobacterales bacterium]